MKTADPTLYFACQRCGSPNPSGSTCGDVVVICHSCQRSTPGPTSKRSARLLTPSSGAQCPFFCSASRSRPDRLCEHNSDEHRARRAESRMHLAAACTMTFALSGVLAFAILQVLA
jgi:hypothetical protein